MCTKGALTAPFELFAIRITNGMENWKLNNKNKIITKMSLYFLVIYQLLFTKPIMSQEISQVLYISLVKASVILRFYLQLSWLITEAFNGNLVEVWKMLKNEQSSAMLAWILRFKNMYHVTNWIKHTHTHTLPTQRRVGLRASTKRSEFIGWALEWVDCGRLH